MYILRYLDPEGVEARSRYRLKRRVYSVPGPNFMWHSDNHDKLKRYGFPMYGFIDGFSKKVLSVEVATTNNNPHVIAHYFLQLVKKQQCLPTILRTDKGTEATLIGELQMALRFGNEDDLAGFNSHIKGKSTHNQRIESYWREFREHLLDFYIQLFKVMESENVIDVTNPVHIDCLRFCFGKLIKEEISLTRKEWNQHHVRRQKNRDIPGGKPNELYHWPEKIGGEDCRKVVNLDHVNLCLNEYAVVPHLCPPEFVEIVEFVLPGTQIPSTVQEAYVLYETLVETITNYF